MGGWSDDFIRECDQRRRAPVYLVESLPRDASPSWGVGRSWSAATHQGYGADADLVSVAWSPPTLNITGWASTMGGFSFVLRRWDKAVDTLRRGYVVVLKMGFSGWTPEEFQTVALGRLRGMRIDGAACIVSVDGPDSLFVSRQSVGSNSSQLFGSVFASTTLDAAYTPGDASLDVASVSGFERETSGTGALQVTPDAGDPFYLTWTANGGGAFTVGTASRFGSTSAAADAGNLVKEVGYVYGHPMTQLRKLMLSTGTGDHGTYDVLPETWGLGIPPEYVATGDIAVWKSRYEPGSGPVMDFDWVIDPAAVITRELEWRFGYPVDVVSSLVYGQTYDGLALLRTLQPAGVWTTLRQGQITTRCAIPGTRYTLDRYVTETIDDDDVGEIIALEPWDSRVLAAYRTVTATDGANSFTYTRSDAGERHVPRLDNYEIDCSQLIHATVGDATSMLTLIAEHVGTWLTQIPGVVRLRIRRWRAARLCLGDVVSLTLDRGGIQFEAVPGIVTGLTIFDGASSTIEITFPEGEVSGAVT
jgi:hypothetical protein